MSLYGKVIKQCNCGGDIILNESAALLIYPPMYQGNCNQCDFYGYYDLTEDFKNERAFYAGLRERD